jgi:cation:H+ antiporter
MFNFANYPVWINLVIFALAGGIVCFSGARLSIYADTIADRTGWGRAFIGALLLGRAASLPEIATTTTASAISNAPLAANNLLGIFAAMDRPSMFMGALAIILTCVFLWGLLERDNQTIYRMGVDSTIVISIYFGGLLLLYSINNGVPT